MEPVLDFSFSPQRGYLDFSWTNNWQRQITAWGPQTNVQKGSRVCHFWVLILGLSFTEASRPAAIEFSDYHSAWKSDINYCQLEARLAVNFRSSLWHSFSAFRNLPESPLCSPVVGFISMSSHPTGVIQYVWCLIVLNQSCETSYFNGAVQNLSLAHKV